MMILLLNKIRMQRYFKTAILYFFLLSILFSLDQGFKNFVLEKIGFQNSALFIPGIASFYVVKNTGGAFSIFSKYPTLFQIIGLFNFLIFFYLIFYPKVKLNTISKIGSTFILSGICGNLFDRFTRGAVIDFIDLDFVSFAVFNLADVFIDVGIILILVDMYIVEKYRKKI